MGAFVDARPEKHVKQEKCDEIEKNDCAGRRPLRHSFGNHCVFRSIEYSRCRDDSALGTLRRPRHSHRSAVQLIGTSNAPSWKMSDWGKTDGNGVLSVGGVFPAGTEGQHRLRVDIGGLLSNPVSFTVSKCTP